jgi:hypothetical protein
LFTVKLTTGPQNGIAGNTSDLPSAVEVMRMIVLLDMMLRMRIDLSASRALRPYSLSRFAHAVAFACGVPVATAGAFAFDATVDEFAC